MFVQNPAARPGWHVGFLDERMPKVSPKPASQRAQATDDVGIIYTASYVWYCSDRTNLTARPGWHVGFLDERKPKVSPKPASQRAQSTDEACTNAQRATYGATVTVQIGQHNWGGTLAFWTKKSRQCHPSLRVSVRKLPTKQVQYTQRATYGTTVTVQI